MICPMCDGELTVLESRPTADNWQRRRRVCHICKYRFTTYEMPTSDYELILEKIRDLNSFLTVRKEWDEASMRIDAAKNQQDKIIKSLDEIGVSSRAIADLLNIHKETVNAKLKQIEWEDEATK